MNKEDLSIKQTFGTIDPVKVAVGCFRIHHNYAPNAFDDVLSILAHAVVKHLMDHSMVMKESESIDVDEFLTTLTSTVFSHCESEMGHLFGNRNSYITLYLNNYAPVRWALGLEIWRVLTGQRVLYNTTFNKFSMLQAIDSIYTRAEELWRYVFKGTRREGEPLPKGYVKRIVEQFLYFGALMQNLGWRG